ncbi:MAG TPA: hypothetical protein VJR04_17590 [Terriglobales bacterium]|nr:hypothetical protein [Terriglobales bacterium]
MDAESKSDQEKNFDQWLDSALRARSNAEPRMGLEERVLARLESEPQRTRMSLWPLFALAAAALSVVIGIALLRPGKTGSDILSRQNPPHSSGQIDRRPSIRAMAAPKEEARAPLHFRHSSDIRERCCRFVKGESSVARSESLPKLAAFPTPRPETEQERLLLRVAEQPGLLQTAHLNSDLTLRELSIPALNIPPLEGTPPDNSPLY